MPTTKSFVWQQDCGVLNEVVHLHSLLEHIFSSSYIYPSSYPQSNKKLKRKTLTFWLFSEEGYSIVAKTSVIFFSSFCWIEVTLMDRTISQQRISLRLFISHLCTGTLELELTVKAREKMNDLYSYMMETLPCLQGHLGCSSWVEFSLPEWVWQHPQSLCS